MPLLDIMLDVMLDIMLDIMLDPFDAPLVPVLAWCPRTGRSLNLRSGRWHSKPHSSFPEAVYLLLHLLP